MRVWGFLLIAVVVVPSCTSDGSALRRRDMDSGVTGTGGTATAGAGGQAGFAGGAGMPAAGTTGMGGTAGVDAGPPGPSTLILVHGVADSPRIAFCFAPFDSAVGAPFGDPIPAGGLGYGESFATRTLEGIDFDTDSFQPIVIAGDLTLIAGSSCVEALERVDELATGPDAGVDAGQGGASGAGGVAGAGGLAVGGMAGLSAGGLGGMSPDASVDAGMDASLDGGSDASGGSAATDASADASDGGMQGDASGPPDAMPPPDPPALRALGMPVFPARTFSGGGSFLVVPNGCIGGPAFTASVEQVVCGPGYAPTNPTLRPVVARLDTREASNLVGMQVLNAAATPDEVTIESVPGVSGTFIVLADELDSGGITDQDRSFTRSSYGAPLEQSTVEARLAVATMNALSVGWQDVLDRGGTDLADGTSYALILIGPRVGLGSGSWWNPSTVTIVESVPFGP